MLKTAVFTIVSKNYWAFARTLMQSLAKAQPDWERHVLLVDRQTEPSLPDDEIFATTLVEELDLPDIKGFLFRYAIMELNTAVKPWMFEHLRKKGYQRIVYLDPDILVLKPLVDVERLLEEGATAVVPPHLTAPLNDNRSPSELDIMRFGVYNLGFMAIGESPENDRLAQADISERFILPIKEAVLSQDSSALTAAGESLPAGISLGGILEILHHKVAGKPPSYQRLQQYRSICSVRQFLAMGGRQFRRYFGGEANAKNAAPLFRLSTSVRSFCPDSPNVKADTPGVNIFGYARSEHGVGQSLRVCSNSFNAAGVSHLLIDFNVGNLARTEDSDYDHLIVDEPSYPVNLFHINADQIPVLYQHMPNDFFKNRYNIGYWAWELPEFPDIFMTGFKGIDEIWVPSGFVQDSISRKSPVPVIKIPHSIQFNVGNCSRAEFGLPEQCFLFLTMYDFSSYQERKNPKASLDAFDRAFSANDNRVALVIKTQNSHHWPEAAEELKSWVDGHKNVIWLDRTLTRHEVYSLESLCDSYLSLHRSEGFGFGLAEAMYLGKPVIATNWSGNTDFMRQDNSLPVNYKLVTIEKSIGVYEKGQQWAEPDIEHAAHLMRKVVDDPELCSRIGHAAQQSIKTELSPLRIGKMLQQRLRFIQSYLR